MKPGTFKITVEPGAKPDKDGCVPFTVEWGRRAPDAQGRTYRAQEFFANPAKIRASFAGLAYSEVRS